MLTTRTTYPHGFHQFIFFSIFLIKLQFSLFFQTDKLTNKEYRHVDNFKNAKIHLLKMG